MINLRGVVTQLNEITQIPSFIANDVTISDIYLVAKSDLPSFSLLKDYDDIVRFTGHHFEDICEICNKDFLASLEGDQESVALTMLVYASYSWCVKMSIDLRLKERNGQIIQVNTTKAPTQATIH